MKFSMTGQEKCDLLIHMTASVGLTTYLLSKNVKIYVMNSITMAFRILKIYHS